MANKLSNIIAGLLLGAMFVFMIASSAGDSATFDEVAHIGAGYTYLKYQDSRLNPEHPPLIKDLAAFPLLFLKLNFEVKNNFWTMQNVNDRQWMAGSALLYEFGNNPDQILFWSRLPIIILAVIFGWLIFSWIKKRYGNKPALLTIIFYSLSPTFIAHSRFVTTDLAASFGFFLGITFFLNFLEKRTAKSLILTGIIFGIAQLLKFSLVLLIPVYLILGILWVFIKIPTGGPENSAARKPELAIGFPARPRLEFLFPLGEFLGIVGQIILIGLIGLVVIFGVYAFHVWNYPQSQQLADAKYVLAGYKVPFVADIDFQLISNKITRPLGQYLLGFLMVARRTAGGNSAYFEGEISSKGWPSYFPTLILVKEQLAFYIFAAIAAVFGILKTRGGSSRQAFFKWIRDNFNIAASAIFVIFYFAWSIWSPLNIGVRHAMPIFPFLYFLVAIAIAKWIQGNIPGYLISSLLIFWMICEIIFAFPFYLSYYNNLGGGIKNGYLIATDSNYDWGQDLKRLKAWIKSPVTGSGVDKIYLDYFGGGSPKYYLGEKFVPWQGSLGAPPARSYFAVSINSVTGNNAYSWLKGKSPIGRAGTSILIYRIQ